jgi:hypothetical protein
MKTNVAASSASQNVQGEKRVFLFFVIGSKEQRIEREVGPRLRGSSTNHSKSYAREHFYLQRLWLLASAAESLNVRRCKYSLYIFHEIEIDLRFRFTNSMQVDDGLTDLKLDPRSILIIAICRLMATVIGRPPGITSKRLIPVRLVSAGHEIEVSCCE